MQDGTRVRGWLMRAHRQTPSLEPALVYFGGRSEEVSWISARLAALHGVHSLFLNYRGYGASQGHPSERAILADALTLYDWTCSQPGVDPHRVGVIGRSLGCGIAAYVASERPAAAVVLITPYDSIVEIARRRFPYCAAGVLLKHRFDALGFARRARAPALMLLAEVDTIIPKHHALHLIEAWAGKKEVVVIQNTNHCDVQEHVHSWQAIADFVTQQFNLPRPE
jgi:cephalosporin-C deacetylase-like acetyl esterase